MEGMKIQNFCDEFLVRALMLVYRVIFNQLT